MVKKKRDIDHLKGADITAIVKGVDHNFAAAIVAIWLCKNKEAKNCVIIFLLIVVTLLLVMPESAVFLHDWIAGLI